MFSSRIILQVNTYLQINNPLRPQIVALEVVTKVIHSVRNNHINRTLLGVQKNDLTGAL